MGLKRKMSVAWKGRRDVILGDGWMYGECLFFVRSLSGKRLVFVRSSKVCVGGRKGAAEVFVVCSGKRIEFVWCLCRGAENILSCGCDTVDSE